MWIYKDIKSAQFPNEEVSVIGCVCQCPFGYVDKRVNFHSVAWLHLHGGRREKWWLSVAGSPTPTAHFIWCFISFLSVCEHLKRVDCPTCGDGWRWAAEVSSFLILTRSAVWPALPGPVKHIATARCPNWDKLVNVAVQALQLGIAGKISPLAHCFSLMGLWAPVGLMGTVLGL